MPKPHKSGLATTAEANVVGAFLIASHSYTLSGEDGRIEDVEAISFSNYANALEMAKKLALRHPEEKYYIFRAYQEVVASALTIKTIEW